jgi:hypothetical protein
MYINGLLRCIARPAGESGIADRRGERQPGLNSSSQTGGGSIDRDAVKDLSGC